MALADTMHGPNGFVLSVRVWSSSALQQIRTQQSTYQSFWKTTIERQPFGVS